MTDGGQPEASGDTGDPLFDDLEDDVFADKDLLKIGHVPKPDRIVGRDAEIQELANHLRDAVLGYSPENVIIYGKTGTGKSLVSRHVTQRAQQAADDDLDIGVAYIDCAEDTTETQAVSTLGAVLNDETETGIRVPPTGLSTSKYYKRLWKVLDERYDAAIVILDEVDLMEDDQILMKLSRAEEAEKTTATVGVIAISNKLHYPDQLNERIKSSLQHKELLFSPYDATQLRDILENREDAFQDGVLSDDVIPLTAAFAAQEHGDARKAIDILRHAGELAHKRGDVEITEDHVREAQRLAEKERFRELTRAAPTQAKITLLALSELARNAEESAFMTSKVYEHYERICNAIDAEVLSMRRIRDILKEQAFLGVIEIEKINRGVAGGVYLNNRLIEDEEIVRETLLEDPRLKEWVEE